MLDAESESGRGGVAGATSKRWQRDGLKIGQVWPRRWATVGAGALGSVPGEAEGQDILLPGSQPPKSQWEGALMCRLLELRSHIRLGPLATVCAGGRIAEGSPVAAWYQPRPMAATHVAHGASLAGAPKRRPMWVKSARGMGAQTRGSACCAISATWTAAWQATTRDGRTGKCWRPRAWHLARTEGEGEGGVWRTPCRPAVPNVHRAVDGGQWWMLPLHGQLDHVCFHLQSLRRPSPDRWSPDLSSPLQSDGGGE